MNRSRIPIMLWLALCLISPAWCATVTAAGNGAWSSTTPNAPWPGGTPPAAGDTVETGTYAVAIDQSVTVAALQNTAAGSYTVAAGGVTITATIQAVGATCVVCSHTTGTVIVSGNILGSAGTAAAYGLRNNGAGIVQHTGNSTGGGTTNTWGVYLAAGTYNQTGNQTGGTGTTAYGLSMAAGSTAVVTGNVRGKAAHGVNMGAATLTVSGTATGSDTTASIHGVNMTTAGATATIGSALGGTQASARGVFVNSASTLNVITATGGTGDSAYGVLASGTTAIIASVDTAVGNDWGPGTAVSGQSEGLCGGPSNASGVVRLRRSIAGARGCAGHRGAVTFTRSASSYIEVRENIGGQFYKRRYVLDTKGRP